MEDPVLPSTSGRGASRSSPSTDSSPGDELRLAQLLVRSISSELQDREFREQILADVAEGFDLDVVAAWMPVRTGSHLRCTGFWSRRPVPTFERSTLGSLVPPGVGLVGRVWAERRSLWSDDLTPAGFVRHESATADRLTCGGAFVATGRTGPIAVIECYRLERRGPDPLSASSAVGPIVGALFERSVAEEDRRELLRAVQRERTLLEAVLRELPVGVVITSATGEQRQWNQVADRLVGLTDGASRPLRLADGSVLSVEGLVRPAAPFGSSGRQELELTGPDGRARVLVAAGGAVHDAAGAEVAWVTTLVDITEDRDRRRRSELLAEAGELFARSLDPGDTLEAVARLCVPRIADLCIVHLAHGGSSQRSAFASALDGAESTFRELDRDPWSEHLAAALLERAGRSRAPIVIDELDEAALRAVAADEQHFQWLCRLRLRQVIVVPVVGRDETLGTIVFGSRSPTFVSPPVVELAAELGRRSGLAVANAHLYERARSVSMALQKSLLPAALPDVPGLELAATYVPGGDGLIVGGDFYDVFRVGPDQWAFMLGDVCGKGVEAAAVTARVRHTVRALQRQDDPATVLNDLNRSLLELDDGERRFCTMIYGVATGLGAGAHVRLGVAGHPSPVVSRFDGTVVPVDAHGMLLGVFEDVAHGIEHVELAPGDTLVMCTDGVFEARGPDGLFGEAGLSAAIASSCRRPGPPTSHDIVAALRNAVAAHTGGATTCDDMAVLALGVPALQGSGS